MKLKKIIKEKENPKLIFSSSFPVKQTTKTKEMVC
jgi:hypothetical protein